MNTRNRVVAAGILIVAFAIPRLAHPQGLDQDLKTGQRESEQANESIYIPFGWKVGDRKQFAVSRTEYRNGIAESSPKQTIFDIEIVSEADEQLVARCLISIVVTEEQKKQSDAIVRQLIELYDELPIEVTISKQGELSGIIDASEFENAFEKTKSEVAKLVDQIDMDTAKKQLAMGIVRETQTFAQFQQDMLAPLNILLMMTNTEHLISERSKSESTTSVLGAENVPTIETVEVVNSDKKTGLTHIRYTQIVEGERAAALVRKALHALLKRVQPDGTPAEITIRGIVSHGVADVVYDTKTGWPIKAQWKSQVNNLKDGNLQMKQELTISANDD